MKLTRLFESNQAETIQAIDRETFIELSAKHKALLLQADDGADPFSVDDFASFAESLGLSHYECKFVTRWHSFYLLSRQRAN